MEACKMRFKWRNFLIGFSLVYALLKSLLFLFFLSKSIKDILEEDEDECDECIAQYLEVIFLSILIISLMLLCYGTIKVNFRLVELILINLIAFL